MITTFVTCLFIQMLFLLNPSPTQLEEDLILPYVSSTDIQLAAPIYEMDVESMVRMITIHTIMDHIVEVNDKITYDIAEEYATHIYNASNKWNLDPMILTSLIHHESRFNNTSVNSVTGAIGLTQIVWKYHKNGLTSSFSTISKREDLLNPKNSIYGGAWILWCYKMSHNGNVKKALARYCPGSKSYVSNVMNLAHRLKTLSTKKKDCVLAKLSYQSYMTIDRMIGDWRIYPYY